MKFVRQHINAIIMLVLILSIWAGCAMHHAGPQAKAEELKPMATTFVMTNDTTKKIATVPIATLKSIQSTVDHTDDIATGMSKIIEKMDQQKQNFADEHALLMKISASNIELLHQTQTSTQQTLAAIRSRDSIQNAKNKGDLIWQKKLTDTVNRANQTIRNIQDLQTINNKQQINSANVVKVLLFGIFSLIIYLAIRLKQRNGEKVTNWLPAWAMPSA